MAKLKNKVAIVTGASKGIGAGIAKSLAAEGASVVVNYASSKQGADKVVSEITAAGGKAIAVQGDVSKQADITRLFNESKKAYGKVDILVNNAGVYEFSPLGEITEASIDRIYGLNVKGLILTTQEALKHFPEEGGSVINIGSVAATATPPTSSVYSGTKGAVNTITQVFAKELGPKKIRVNALNPGMIETEGVHAAGFIGSDFQKQLEIDSPLGRIGQTDDVNPVAVFLASDDSRWLTGELISVSGGIR